MERNQGTRPTSPQTVPRLAAMTGTRPRLVCVYPSLSGVKSPTRSSVAASLNLRRARRTSTALSVACIKLLYGPGIAFPGLARLRDIVDMVGIYNTYTDTSPPGARPGPPRPSSASGRPPAAARCGGVTNPTAEDRDAVGRSEAQLGVCIAHPGLSPGPINRRLRRRAQELLLQPVHTFVRHSRTSEPRGLAGLSVTSHAWVLTRSKVSESLLHGLSLPWHGLAPTVINDTALAPKFSSPAAGAF